MSCALRHLRLMTLRCVEFTRISRIFEFEKLQKSTENLAPRQTHNTVGEEEDEDGNKSPYPTLGHRG